MTDATAQGGPAAAADPAAPPQISIVAHFTRDLSFENVGVVKGVSADGKPDINVTVNIDGQAAGENRYQVALKFAATAKNGDTTRFAVELDYGGVFQFTNVAQDHIHPMLFIECPRLLLPFARRVIADVTRDGGYPPLMLDNIDFAGLYRQRIEQLRAEQAAKGETPAATPAAGGDGEDKKTVN